MLQLHADVTCTCSVHCDSCGELAIFQVLAPFARILIHKGAFRLQKMILSAHMS